MIHNPYFKVVEFDHFRMQAGLPSFVMSVSEWIEKTNAIGIIVKKGRYGGTYAFKDIAFEFGTAISPETERGGTETIGMDCQERTIQNQLSHPYRCHQKMIDKIYEVGPYNVSHYCGTPETLKKINVIDISYQRVPIDKRSVFHNALLKRVTKLLDPLNSHDPAFHIEIKQY